MSDTYAISTEQWFFFSIFVLYIQKIFFILFAKFKLLMFHIKIVKISEKKNKQNSMKLCIQVTKPSA